MGEGQDEMIQKRSLNSQNLTQNLAKLFAQMVLANRKYVDPTPVLKSLTDDFGNKVLVGEMRDLGEFNINFLERIEEGLGERVQEAADSEKIEEITSLLLKTQSSFDVNDISPANGKADPKLTKEKSNESEEEQKTTTIASDEARPKLKVSVSQIKQPGGMEHKVVNKA